MSNSTMDRRSFLRLSGLTGTGLFLSFALKNGTEVYAASAQSPAGLTPNAFLRIAPDGSVSIFSHKPEVGQGIRTALPMLVAEELEVDWKSVTVIPGDLDPAYSILGMNQSAGGSNSTPTSYDPLRRMGAIEGETVVSYVHNVAADGMGKIGVLVAFTGADADLARGIAMHIAAINPLALDESSLDLSTRV